MMLLDRDFNSSSSRNIAIENGIGSSPLWFQATGLYVMMLLSERVNFQVSRKRSFVRAPRPPRTSARSLIEVALCLRLYSRYEGRTCSAPSSNCCNQAITVRRERRWTTAGGKTRPGTGSLHPVAIGAAVEATKPLKPPVERVA